MQKTKALLAGHQNYNSMVTLQTPCLEELRWWRYHLQEWNGRSIITPAPDLIITTDSSKRGWGAVCNGITTQGLWNLAEQTEHINALELRAAMFAVKSFTREKTNIHAHIRVDNRTTMSQINKMGGTRSEKLFQITREFWNFCLSKQIILTAEYLPGSLNQIADQQSRVYMDRSNWMLNSTILPQLEQIWGSVDVDLFADRLNTQKKRYVSWKPDPGAIATDAFSISWNQLTAYLFPPFSMIARCLAKVKKDQATAIVVTPVWHAQPWYPTILGMTVSQQILLPPLPDILVSPNGEPHPLIATNGLTLAAWKISGNDLKHKGFLSNLPRYSWTSEEKAHKLLTQAPGKNGVAGVTNKRLIQFRPLWAK
jgi:hypothetical protein